MTFEVPTYLTLQKDLYFLFVPTFLIENILLYWMYNLQAVCDFLRKVKKEDGNPMVEFLLKIPNKRSEPGLVIHKCVWNIS